MLIRLFDRREHLAQLSSSAAALGLPFSSLLQLSASKPEDEMAIRMLFGKLSAGSQVGPGRRNDAWCVVETGKPHDLYIQALVRPERDRIWLEAVSEKFVPGWKQIMSARRIAILAALGFQEPGPRSPNYWQHIPGTGARSTNVAARVAVLALHEVFGARSLAEAQTTLSVPGQPMMKSTLGSFRVA